MRKTDRNGRETEYEYDFLNRITEEHWLNDSNTIEYAYDAASNLTEISDYNADYTYDYDHLNRVTGSTQAIADLTPEIHFDYGYDAASRLTSVLAAIGATDDFASSYAYDAISRSRGWTSRASRAGTRWRRSGLILRTSAMTGWIRSNATSTWTAVRRTTWP